MTNCYSLGTKSRLHVQKSDAEVERMIGIRLIRKESCMQETKVLLVAIASKLR